MRDWLKSIVWVIIFGSVIASAIAWSTTTRIGVVPASLWMWRIVPMIAAVGGVGLLIASRMRPEKAPDYLRQMISKPFECDGLCFGFEPDAVNGMGELRVYFQNRYSRPCETFLSLRRNHGFAWSSKGLECLSVVIRCEGGAFGMMRVPMAVPKKYQGKKKHFMVEGKTAFATGRGELLRFKAGKRVGSQASAAGTMLLAHALLGGVAGLAAASSASTRFTLRYPDDVAEALPKDAMPVTETLWQPGDEVVDMSLAKAA